MKTFYENTYPTITQIAFWVMYIVMMAVQTFIFAEYKDDIPFYRMGYNFIFVVAMLVLPLILGAIVRDRTYKLLDKIDPEKVKPFHYKIILTKGITFGGFLVLIAGLAITTTLILILKSNDYIHEDEVVSAIMKYIAMFGVISIVVLYGIKTENH